METSNNADILVLFVLSTGLAAILNDNNTIFKKPVTNTQVSALLNIKMAVVKILWFCIVFSYISCHIATANEMKGISKNDTTRASTGLSEATILLLVTAAELSTVLIVMIPTLIYQKYFSKGDYSEAIIH